MRRQIPTKMINAAWVLLAAMLFVAQPVFAQSAHVNAARGKSALYVFNRTKLELARKMALVDPKRMAQLEAWRQADEAAIAALQSLGFKVTLADEHSAIQTTRGQDLVLISESVDALEIGTKYRNLDIPLVDMENDLLADLGMTGQKNGRDYGTDENQRFLWMVNAPHPLSAGLAAGIQNVIDDEHFKMNWGKPGLGAITIATLRGEPDKAAIFAYERGATMNDETLAPARRVSLFIWQDVFTHLRPEGRSLFDAAALWAVGISR